MSFEDWVSRLEKKQRDYLEKIESPELPLEIEIKGSVMVAIFSMVVIYTFGNFGYRAALIMANHEFRFEMLIMFPFIIAPIIFLFHGLNQFFLKGRITITNESVDFQKSSLFGRKEFMEYMYNYKGVQMIRTPHAKSYSLQLFHPEKSKRIILCRVPYGKAKEVWEIYCQVLHKPALIERASDKEPVITEPMDIETFQREVFGRSF